MKREEKEKAFKRITMSSVAVREEDRLQKDPKKGRERESIREQQILYLVLKQRRESIEVAEILSLVPQLEEKYNSLE